MMLANPARQMFAQQTAANEMDGAGGMDHRSHHHHHGLFNTNTTAQQQQQRSLPHRKRKAECQPENNERLSKRMSLLNLEQGGTKLYVPVENPQLQQPNTLRRPSPPTQPTHNALLSNESEDDIMHLDDTKHKVYIYNMDDELASSESEAEDGGKLVFLPDIEKHLRKNRILPPYINPSAGPDHTSDLASQMQLVLYNIPSSISVPEEQDSVRKAIMEARARMREKQATAAAQNTPTPTPVPVQPMDIPPSNGFQSCAPGMLPPQGSGMIDDDPDAMELD